MSGPPLLAVEQLTKTYPGTRALSDFNLELRAGEVHGLIGENGAGKTTLLMILAGVTAPDGGRITIEGREVRFAGPKEAQAAGIGTVFQELSLVDGLTVAENVFANRAPVGPLTWLDRKRLFRETQSLLQPLASTLSPNRRVATLTTGGRQIVEIAKALSLKARVLLLDEPTSALSLAEASNLFTVIRRLKAQGIVIVFVSHRLAEVFEIADRITIMRDGQLVGSYDRSAIDPEQAVRLMVGRVLSRLYPPRAQSTGPPRLELRSVRSGPVGPVDLTVHAGEIVGLAGLVGSGRSRLVRALFGVERIDDGMVLVEGRPVRLRSPWHAVRWGMGMVPSDRKGEGVFQRMSLERNLLAAALNRITRMGLVQPRAGRRLGQELVRALGIRARGLDQAMVRLSGGNQQKAVLARWIATRPRVLIVDEPTQGIDVGAKAEIHRLLRQLANDGLAVLMVSSDLPELLGMCDRIAVMAGGRVQAVFDGRSATEEGVMTLAAGGGAA